MSLVVRNATHHVCQVTMTQFRVHGFSLPQYKNRSVVKSFVSSCPTGLQYFVANAPHRIRKLELEPTYDTDSGAAAMPHDQP